MTTPTTDSSATPAAVPEDVLRDRRITFGRVLSRDRRRLVVDVCGVPVAFSTRDRKVLSPHARGYKLVFTMPVFGDELGHAALRYEPPPQPRARRASADPGRLP